MFAVILSVAALTLPVAFGDYWRWHAASLEARGVSPSPSPSPNAPVKIGDSCPKCGGDGWNEADGRRENWVRCVWCEGDGRADAGDPILNPSSSPEKTAASPEKTAAVTKQKLPDTPPNQSVAPSPSSAPSVPKTSVQSLDVYGVNYSGQLWTLRTDGRFWNLAGNAYITPQFNDFRETGVVSICDGVVCRPYPIVRVRKR